MPEAESLFDPSVNELGDMRDRLWSVDDLARFLGVPVQTIYAWPSG